MTDEINFRAASERIASLIGELGSVDDPRMRQNAEELIGLVTEMHGAALGRILQLLNEDEVAKGVIDLFCMDPLVAGVLALHGLHPQAVEKRITQALETVRAQLSSNGASVELIKVENGVAYLRLDSRPYSCLSSKATVKKILETIIEQTAPEIDQIQIDGMGEPGLSSAEHAAANSAIPAQTQRGAGCELCGNALGRGHRHVAEIKTRKLLCACRACSFLFNGNRGPEARYRTVPQRYVDLAESAITAAEWDELQIPIGVAFFFFNSAVNRMVACYPGPAGATESLLPLECWNNIVRSHPVLDSLAADVEAILVDGRRERESPLSYVIPIDACYEIVARLRSHWKGFDGGDAARREIDAFFAELRSRSQAAVESDQA